MKWHLRYLVRSYLQNSIWLYPTLGIFAALGTSRILHWIEHRNRFSYSGVAPGAARDVLLSLAASIFTCVVFTSSTLLLVVQLASAYLTPRIIAVVFRDKAIKLILTVFVFVFTLALAVAARVGDALAVLPIQVVIGGSVTSLGLFLYLIDRVGKFLRPSGALRVVGQTGYKVIQQMYPRRLPDSPAIQGNTRRDGPDENRNRNGNPDLRGAAPTRTITARVGGVIRARHDVGLIALARRFDCIIVMVPRVGDFVARGQPLFQLFQGGQNLPSKAACQCIAMGVERTFEQDPGLALRLIVDVASKALSPAINDPTTAVLAIDEIHHLLRTLGGRDLNEGCLKDSDGQLRLVFTTPNWEDFVWLAVTEIRQYGSESIQVVRRLRAMLENLSGILPEERAGLLQQELRVVQRSSKRMFREPEDRARADVADPQGVGGGVQEAGQVGDEALQPDAVEPT